MASQIDRREMWRVGKDGDKSFPITYHETETAAEQRIVEIQQTDPAGVHRGDYFLLSPEEED